ncbi:Methionine synthase [Nocardia africana]|uniref:Methionine synthase n=1 Tax=Nocardia africana TaxID=134964 RepID=A0A378WTL2_9NOCA|nr:Methionine synthase [Nocardia africana]
MSVSSRAEFDTTLLDTLARRVVIGDGAMGTMLQAADLTLDDFRGLEGCNEILNETRPDVLRGIHRAYYEAGADAVETNTFGCNLPNLADYDIADRIRDLSERGTRLAREVADEMGPSADGTPRYVLGSMGPGTKLPTLGHAPFVALRDAYAEAALGMLEGGADAILIETCQDLLQVKAAVTGSRRAMERAGRRIPIITHVTVETTGTMLVGSEIGAALTAIEPLGVDMIGLNCATGPDEMSEHLRHLSKHAQLPVSVMPNAGLPVLGPRAPNIRSLRANWRARCTASSPNSASRWSAAAAAPPRSTSARSPTRSRMSPRRNAIRFTSRACPRCTPRFRSNRTPRS